MSYEQDIKNFWEVHNIYEKINTLTNQPIFRPLEGPPFVSSQTMHIGHILISTLKDIVIRYKLANGFYCENRLGFDVHGLPSECKASSELGLKTTQDIKNYGTSKFEQFCKQMIKQYIHSWEPIYRQVGRWTCFDKPYTTMDTKFMESTWWAFNELFKKGLVYKSSQIVPYSIGCATPLSNFEAGEKYKDVPVDSLYVRFPLIENNKVSFLAWTTTAFTLPANMALCVNPDAIYEQVHNETLNEDYIVASVCLKNLENNEKFKKTGIVFKGSELVGKQYVPPFLYLERNPEEYIVIADSFVNVEPSSENISTGIVHIAPAFGNDDMQVCLKNGLITRTGEKNVLNFCPINDYGNYTANITDFVGENVLKVAKKVIEKLKQKKLVYAVKRIMHRYPFCYRSDTELIYRAFPCWYIKIEEIKEKLLEISNKITWIPQHAKNRFDNWVSSSPDWCISRERFFGNPIPIWTSDDGQEIVCIGSIQELVERANLKDAPTDLHCEFINPIEIPSQKGKGMLKRIAPVFDCIAGGTPISLYNETSVMIEDLETKNENILAFDEKCKGLVKSTYSVFVNRGKKECIELILEDGRKLTCTPNHRILTLTENNETEWVKAKDLKIGNSKLLISVTYPVIQSNETDKLNELEWQLTSGTLVFKTDTYENKVKSMAFCRLLGFMLTDGSFQKHNTSGTIGGICFAGHQIDADKIKNDIKLISNEDASIKYDEKSNVYCVYIPHILLNAFILLDGVTIGRRIDQDALLPTFLTDKKCVCPKILKAEFIGGMFGGDGCCPSFTRRKTSGSGYIHGCYLTASRIGEKLHSLKEMLECLQLMLKEFNVDSTISNQSENLSSKKCISQVKKYSLTLNIKATSLLQFSKNICFHYCVHKQMRITSLSTWYNLQSEVNRQNNFIIEQVSILTDYTNVYNELREKKISSSEYKDYILKNCKISIKDAYSKSLELLQENEVIINEKYFIGYSNIEYYLRRLAVKGNLLLRSIPHEQWFKMIGALKFFTLDENTDTKKITYGVPRNSNSMPVFYLKLIGVRQVGEKQVYDITVPTYESFLSNGIVTHNCWFESASVPYGQIHYPFENRELIDKVEGNLATETFDERSKSKEEYISDIVIEGSDQISRWFYVLNVLSCALFNKPAFKTVMCAGLILDAEGTKISKKYGNFVNPCEYITEFGADFVRLYLAGSPATKANALKFDTNSVKRIKTRMLPFINAINFFEEAYKYFMDQTGETFDFTYVSTDFYDIWITSKLQLLINNVIDSMNKYELEFTVNKLIDFVDVVANWYIGFNRNRMKGKTCKDDAKNSLVTLYKVLLSYTSLIAPFMPFLAEHIYQRLCKFDKQQQNESIFMITYPKKQMFPVNDEVLYKFSLLQDVCYSVRTLRSNLQMAQRIPINHLYVYTKTQEDIITLEKLLPVLEEMNYINVTMKVMTGKLHYTYKANQKTLGIKYKKDAKWLINMIESLPSEFIEHGVHHNLENFSIKHKDKTQCVSYEINIKDDILDVLVNSPDCDLENKLYKDNLLVGLDVTYNERVNCLYQGKLMARSIQNFRKVKDLHPWNKIYVYTTNFDKNNIIQYKEFMNSIQITKELIEMPITETKDIIPNEYTHLGIIENNIFESFNSGNVTFNFEIYLERK